MAQIRRRLTDKAVLLTDPDRITELLCDTDEAMLDRYLEGEQFAPEVLQTRLAAPSQTGNAYPVLSGSALRNEGIAPLMDAITDYFPEPEYIQELCGVVFAAQQDRTLGRGVWVRLFGGVLENRMAISLPAGIDPVTGETRFTPCKITQIRAPGGEPVGKLRAGEIGIVYGLGNVPIGHILGSKASLPRIVEPGSLHTPLITVQAVPKKKEQMQALRTACQILSGEDPLLEVRYIRSLDQLHLHVMGTIQLEILEEILCTRFDLGVTFTEPAIIYRETVVQRSEGYVAYLAPKPCWAILKFEIDPAPRGNGITFVSNVPVRQLQTRYQHQVEQALPLALRQGRLGWQVTDVKIALTEGGEHQFHTHPLDFIVATPMAIQDGLVRGGSILLEPILEARFLLPPECVGKVMTDLIAMRGEVISHESDADRAILTGLVPVQTSLDYAITLAASTGGRGAMSVRLHGYRECPLELGATAQRRGVDPLDTSKYILAARSALEGSIFDTE